MRSVGLVLALLLSSATVGAAAERSNAAASLEPFRVAGCTGRGDERLECTPQSAIGRAGCDQLAFEPPLKDLGVPVAMCLKLAREGMAAGEYVRGPAGMMPLFVRYLVATGDGFELLRSPADLGKRFSPVHSEAVALALATMVTGFVPGPAVVPPATYRTFLSNLPATVTERTPAGYVVRALRDAKLFGCGPHTTYLADVAVSVDGVVKEVARRKAFENPAEDGLCVD